MGQAELDNKLSAIVPDTVFKLDERSTLDILNWLKAYTGIIPFDKAYAEKIPFDQEKKQFWDSFYFIQENTPEELADIYQHANKADGLLPPHQAFVFAFLKLLETPNRLLNTFPARHRDLYYRELLGLSPRKAQADSVALGITLNTDNSEYLIPKGTLFDAGQDSVGNPLQYTSETDLLANQGELTDLRWYRKDKDKDSWQSTIPLSLSDNIALPENGIQLFNPTANDVPVLSGYLIKSSLFSMPAGERHITLTLENDWEGQAGHLTAKISAEDHWLSLLAELIDKKNIKLELSSTADPTSPPDNLDGMTFDIPVLKLGTTQKPMLPKITGIEININGNRSVHYASDGGIEQTDTASFPFGQSPSLGSGFNLVAPEWYGTENATLTMTPQWVGLPTSSFSTWYEKYNPKPASNGVFAIQGYLVTSQKRDALNNAESQSLFGGTGAPQGQSLTFTLPEMHYPLTDSPSPNEWPASVRIELAEQDFMHAQYWQNPTDKNVPYTPQISALQIQFSAKAKPEQFTVYPLTPFGWANTNEDPLSFTNDALYLGFTNVLPGQTLSLYWQLEGFKALNLSWFYLNQSNTWSSLDKLVDDQTHNLFDQGIWRTLLPQDASNQATLMPTGRYWLKAEITHQAESQDYPRIKGILYNAATATLINAELVETDHFINGLPADSITQPVNALVAIDSVNQPWVSWNGRPKETEQAFMYWLYLLPNRETEDDKTLAQKRLNDFLKDNRNLGESVSKIIWLQPVDFLLQLDIELDDDVSDLADIFAQVYMTTEQMVLTSPLRYSTQAMIEQGYSNEEIFEGPYLHHGWIPELSAAKDYTKPTELKLSHLANRLLAIPGVQNITRLALGKHDENISPLADDSWSWTIAQGYYPRLWGNDPLDLISSSASPLTITAKGGVKITVSKQDIENKIIAEPLIETQPELLNWGKHRKVLDYYPVSNKLPACYGLQTYAETQQQIHLHQFMLPFEQMLANGCAELDLLPKLLAFKQRGNAVYGTQWPFKTNTVNYDVHENIMTNLIKELNYSSQIFYPSDYIQKQKYIKELTILDYLLGYFGAQCATIPLSLDLPELILEKQEPAEDFLSTQRHYLAQQPELAYHRNNIRIDKVSALQKRIAARLGLGGECFNETPELDELPFYLIEHRQLLPIKPAPQFDEEQTPDNLEIKSEPDTKKHQLIITQIGKANQLLQGQIIDLIITEGDGGNKKVLRSQMITSITADTFTLSTSNSSNLEHNRERVQQAFDQGNLRWQNSSVWLEDMDYQLVYAQKEHEKNERWITVNSQTPFPAMIEVDDEITIEYVFTPSKPGSKTLYQTDELEYELKVKVVEFDYFENIILVKKEEYSPHNFPLEAEASNYHWYFSNGSILSDRFSFIVSVVLNRQLIEENNNTDPYKLDSWIKSEILAEFPVHLSLIIHWLSPEHFKDFSSTYQRWQNNGAPLGDEAYHVLETLTLGRLPSAATGIGNMRIATAQQRIDVVGESGKEWNTEVIINNQLVYVPYTGENLNKR